MGYRNDPQALKGFGIRWVAPLGNLVAGVLASLVAVGMALAHRSPGWTALLALLAVVLLFCGLATLVWRIRARFLMDAWRERQANRLGDLATLVAWAALALGPVTWAVHGLVLDLRAPYAVEGYVARIDLSPGRRSSGVQLWLMGGPRAFIWSCRRSCDPWEGLEAEVRPGAAVRIMASGDRIFGLATPDYTLLAPAEERRRWIWADLTLGAVGLLFAGAAGAAVIVLARRFPTT
jgi:hypothetical protein